MKGKQKKGKKRIAKLIAAALVAGIAMPSFINYVSVVKASAPAAGHYVGVDGLVNQLANTDVHINFGTNGPKLGEWYVAGTDGTQITKNAILFSGQHWKGLTGDLTAYQSSTGANITYKDEFGDYGQDDTGTSKAPGTVELNHYGASTLRKTLNQIQTGGAYFTTDEGNLVLQKELELTDANGAPYKIADKFYAPVWDGANLTFGGSNIALKNEFLTNSADELWTQSPVQGETAQAYGYASDTGALAKPVQEEKKILPVFELDLSKVRFASTVPLAANVGASALADTDKETMVLRANGKETVFAKTGVAYNKDYIRCDAVPNGSFLIIQGSTDGIDWYYKKNISETETISAADVKTSVNTGAGVNIDVLNFETDGCKIWIETRPNSSNSFAYAIEAEKGIINYIELDGIEYPEPGVPLNKGVTCRTFGVRGETTKDSPSISWYLDGKEVGGDAQFDKVYTAQIKLSALQGYQFPAGGTVTVKLKTTEGKEFEVNASPSSSSELTVECNKFITDPDKEITYDPAEAEYSGEYDGLRHGIELRNIKPADAIVSYSLRVEGQEPDWNKSPDAFAFKDVGEYDIDFRITKDGYDTINTWLDKTLKPGHISITPRLIKVIPGDQRIRWGDSLNPDKYELSKDTSLVSGDVITKLTLSPSTTDVTDSGLIYAFSGKDEDGNNYVEIRDNNGKGDDVTDNYSILTDIPGNLIIEHNPDIGPESLTIDKAKTEYILGEPLTINDLNVIARYPDGFTERVTDYTTNAEDIDMSTLGGKSLTVTYTKGEGDLKGTATASLTIRVVEEPDRNNNDDDNNDDNNNNGNNNGNNNDNNNNNPGNSNNNNGNNNNTGNNPTTSQAQPRTTATTTGTTNGASNNTTGTKSTGTSTNSSTTRRTTSARTGDTNPIVIWVLAALASGVVIVSLLLFQMGRGGKKKKSRK